MTKNIEVIKIHNYDLFKCTGDKCNFTCCEGWDISLDKNTYNKLNKKETRYILESVIECGEEYRIDKAINEKCPLLDSNGLCNVVKNHGDEYLSQTCRTFPRIMNDFNHKEEWSLSCACPEVIEIIARNNNKIAIPKATDKDELDVKLRSNMIDLIQNNNFKLEEKILAIYYILNNILDNYEDEEFITKEADKLLMDTEIKKIIQELQKKDNTFEKSIRTLKSLFLDITYNYKNISVLQPLLKDICTFSESKSINIKQDQWEKFKVKIDRFNYLIENTIVTKIFNSCANDDIEEITIAFQTIALEYLLARYAIFLKSSINEEKVNIEQIKDYIMAFSRIIGNNEDSVLDFFEETIGDYILSVEYLSEIILV